MKLYTLSLVLLLICFFSSCVTQNVNVIEGVKYDETKNVTDYFVMPYGNVSLPGKWDKTHHNSISRQQFFANKDSVKIAIALGNNKYEFNADGAKKGFDFVKSFYDWDSKYFVDKYGLNRSLIEEDSLNNYIIWKITGKTGKSEFDTHFLIGEKKGKVSNFSIMITDKWTEVEKINFLKGLYLN